MENFFRFQDQQIYIGSGNLNHNLTPGCYAMKYNQRTGEAYIEQVAAAKIDKTKVTSQMTEILGIVTSFASGVKSNKFAQHNYKSKFGVLLEGPPGTGKSQTVNNCVNSFVASGGICVFIADNAVYHSHLAGQYLKKLNLIQPNTPILLILEDLDSVDPRLEVYLTSILDGEQSPHNTFFLGTTNFMENISKRILRPGRFDLIYKVAGLDDETRKAYINEKIEEFSLSYDNSKKEELYNLTKGFNFSEIRTFMSYLGFFGFEAKNLASKVARLDAQDPEMGTEAEKDEYSDPSDFSNNGDDDDL
jgi:ATP-dependent 26S proteasome regulatory subunit